MGNRWTTVFDQMDRPIQSLSPFAGNQTKESATGAVTGYVYDGENRLKKVATPLFAVTTYSYGGDGLRRSYQKPEQPINTIVWDGSDYLGEI